MGLLRRIFGLEKRRAIGTGHPYSEYLELGLIKIWCVSHDHEMNGWIAIRPNNIASMKIGKLDDEWTEDISLTIDVGSLLNELSLGWKHEYAGSGTRRGYLAVARGDEYNEIEFDRGNIKENTDVIQDFLMLVSEYFPIRIHWIK